ncbi:hypothetical protein [Paraflavitalea sp. CAU 1676]|uniref:hypothetical protein n=1 Tax=Paraflavitalea sp. CAU 1676 TaxID=3032598 RepID=UPI0023DBD0CF|nr:hypothetical protein [Paraflavitalea sp. CAU 1676]MDF2188017.1 hypothetical protein [Paraflavitalea sp. CAU 1676]
MKRFTTVGGGMLLLLLLFLALNGRSQTIVGKIYVTFSDQITVFGLNGEGNLDQGKDYAVKKGTKFSVVGFDSQNNVLITFWRYYRYDATDTKGKTKLYTKADTFTKQSLAYYPPDSAFIGVWANFKRFAISPRVLNSACKEYFGGKKEFTWGVMTLPIKARLGNGGDNFFDFEERLNLGFVFGRKKQLEGYASRANNWLLGFGITSVKTDSLSLKEVQYYEGKTALALSLHGGYLYQFDAFQVGAFLGVDFVPGKVGRTWKNQGRPWIGLAIGVALFSKTTDGGTGDNEPDKKR